MIKRLLRNRKGISIAEVIVAMSMLLIITGAAMSVQIASSRADAIYRNQYNALNACENAAECVRFANGDEELLKGTLGKAGFTEAVGAYTLTCGDRVVKVTVEAEHETEKYVVTCDDEIIYEYIVK